MMWKSVSGVVLVLAIGCGGAPRTAPRTTSEAAIEVTRDATSRPASPVVGAAPAEVIHVLEPGQTLWSVARRYNVDVDAVARANGIDDPDRIAAGTRLRIPGARPDRSLVTPDWSWPIPGGSILSRFGAPRRTHVHQGIDIRGERGEPILAAEAGEVVYAGSTMRGYGKTVILDHGNGLRTLYAHNSSLLVVPGQRVARGQSIARVGRSGNATTEHCHFEVRLHEVPVNPMDYLSTQLADSEVSR